jgi:zinc protease
VTSDRLLARYGAQERVRSAEDVTCHSETLPATRYATALELEADRMRNALISLEETEAERTVIVSEREDRERSVIPPR